MKNNVLFIFCLTLFFSCSNSNEKKAALSGQELYAKNCTSCHGADGKKGLAKAADLSISTLTLQEQKQIITEGKNTMAAFKHALNGTEIDSIVVYIQQLKK